MSSIISNTSRDAMWREEISNYSHLRFITLIFLLLFVSPRTHGQDKPNYTDSRLAQSFKVFQSVDVEMANHLLPFIASRFERAIKFDSSTFRNDFPLLSERMGIKYSSDSLLKTYCWDERSGGCCHFSATYAQFKMSNGYYKLQNFDELETSDEEIFISAIHTLELDSCTIYLILGSGTCCGGKHYSIARAYRIGIRKLEKVNWVFEDSHELRAGANRNQTVNLTYDPEQRVLSYNEYEFDGDTGFYTNEMTVRTLNLTDSGFQ